MARHVVVRRAADGEKFVTLDGKKHTLTEQMLLIADETKGVALAGVMGGQNSEINPGTTDVLIESACFKPQNIRATSKKLDLRTDSSYRFERGADMGICDWASRRAAQLILQPPAAQCWSRPSTLIPTRSRAGKSPLRYAKIERIARRCNSRRRPDQFSASASGWKSQSRPIPHCRDSHFSRRSQARSGFDRGNWPALRRRQNSRHPAARRHWAPMPSTRCTTKSPKPAASWPAWA